MAVKLVGKRLSDVEIVSSPESGQYVLLRADGEEIKRILASNLGGGGDGTGDVTGPASSADNAIVRFDGSTGNTIQSSPVAVDDAGNITIVADNRKISAGKGLTLEQAGDLYGTTRMLIQNRDGLNGALFEQAGTVDLIDFAFKTLTAQSHIRLESRSGETHFGGDEFRIGDPLDPTLFVNATGGGVEVARGPLTVNGLPVGSNVPKSRDMTSSGNLLLTDRGHFVKLAAAITPTIPNSTFSEGDVITLVNRSGSDRSVTCSITECWVGGSNVGSFTISSNQMASILFMSSTECVVSGAVL